MAKSDSQAVNKTKFKVSGKVSNSRGELIQGQQILATDVDLRGAAIYKTASTIRELEANRGFDFLGRAETNIDGYYEIEFTADQYRRNEIGLADVVVFAVDTVNIPPRSVPKSAVKSDLSALDGNIIARSRLATQKDYAGNEIQNLDIQLPDASKRGVSEYARLMQALAPFVKENGLQLFELSASDDQIDFLATETNQDQAHTSLAVQADKLRSDYPRYGFSSELFYGIGRQNVTLSWVSLLQKTESDLLAAIKQSVDQNIISPQADKAVEAFLGNVTKASLEHSAGAPETADFYKTVGFSVKDATLQKTFVQAYLQFNGTPEDFWNGLAQKPGFTPEVVQALQLSNQLSILTGQHAPLIEELQVNKKIKDLSDLISLNDNDWNAIIKQTGVPDSVPGNTQQEKASSYIVGMQSALNAAYPTRKIALMIAHNQLPFKDADVKKPMSAFLAAAQKKGFDISVSRITDFDGLIKEVAGDELHDQVLQHLQLMQRIYQISPTPEVMSTLMAKGYTSARRVSAISQNLFISLEAADLGGTDVAFSVYNRARHQVMRAQHTLLKVQDTQDRATPSKVITRQQQKAIGDYLNTLNKSIS